MMKKKLLGLLMLVSCFILSLCALTACNNTPEKPEGGSWTTYSENKIWTKTLTLKFEDEETFKVYSGSDQWIVGNYKFAKNPGTSTLTLWNADTAIPDIEKDGEKTYEPVDGVYTIEFDHGAGGKSKFLFQPPQDGTKPGQETNQPKPPCDTHVDSDNDGKCDECGADMPEKPADKELQLTMQSAADEGGKSAQLLMYSDNTWEIGLSYYAGMAYMPSVSGTWSQRADWSGIDLTVTKDEGNLLAEDTLFVSINAQDPNDIKYSLSFTVNVPQAGGEMSFTLAKVENSQPNEPDNPTPDEKELKSEEAEFWGGVGKAYIGFDAEAGTFAINVNAGQGFSAWLNGTYTMSDGKLSLTATWTEGANSTYLADATSGEAKEYKANNGTYVIGVVLPSAGTVNFKFVPDPDAVKQEKQYVVTFDFGNGSTSKVLTETFEAADGTTKQYVPSASSPEVPYLLGKRFAGWDRSNEPVLKDGVSTTKFMLGVNSNSYYDTGAIEKDVMEVTEDITLYARWVTPQWIATEADLRNMSNDLSGWYILKNDITLTQDWKPVGIYYSSYEFLSPSWWKYSFSGQLDGNGYSINGLKISTLTPYGDTVHPVDGSGNGTTALFGSICEKATITELYIKSPVIKITDYKEAAHGYVSVLAAFVQGSPEINNVHIENANISVTTTDVNYVSVSGLLAGHWGGRMWDCTATGNLTVNAKYTQGFTGSTTNLYVGGLVGEGYAFVNNCSSEINVTLNVEDPRALQADSATGKSANVINVYMGSIGASTAYTDNVNASGKLSLDFSKVANTAMTVYMGGIGGIQRTGYLDYSKTSAEISVVSNSNTGNVMYVGSLLGGYDTITSISNLHGKNDLKARLCVDCGVTYSLNNVMQTVDFIGFAPKTAADMQTALMIAGFMGVDLSPYVDADGNYTIYGVDRCQKTNG